MQKKKKKNISQRFCFRKHEIKRRVLKSLTNNIQLKTKNRWKVQTNFILMPFQSSITRIKNRCILTNRPRSIYRFFKISRLQLKKYASTGFLPGVIKRSW